MIRRAPRDAPRLAAAVPRRFAVDQAVRTLRVELHHPVANNLQRHPAIFAASVRVAPS